MSVDEVMSDLHQPWQEHPKLATNLQPTCNKLATDCISRQAAIDAIEPTLKSILQGNSFKAINVMDKIRELPSVQPDIARDIATILENEQDMRVVLQNERKRGRWIPCSERLPDESGDYMLYRPHFWGANDGQITVCYWNNHDWSDNYRNDSERYLPIIDGMAWMPLPEPYEGDTQ